jgi:O-antigen/teichoic acid export membrane protein
MALTDTVRYVRDRIPTLALYVTSTGALVVALGAQFIAFVILARHLGTAQFGKLQTISAATEMAAALCGLGAGDTMIRRVARDPSLYPLVLGHGLILVSTSGIALTVLTATGLSLFVQTATDQLENLGILLIFAVSNIVLFKWINLAEQIFLARRLYLPANIINMGFAIWRSIVTIAACLVFGVDNIWVWSLWYVAVHLCAAAACVVAVRRFGPPQWRLIPEEVKRGFHFTTPFFFNVLRQNVDLVAVGMVSAPATVGRYSAASRIAIMSLVTVHSFNRLLYPKLAIAGRHGISATFRLACRYVVPATALAVVTSVCVFVLAPYMPLLFGAEYGDMVVYLRILCWIPVMVAIQNAIYDALGAADRHGIRAVVYNTGCVIASTLIIGLTRLYGLPGTIAGIYISHASIAVALWITGFVLVKPPAS